MSKKIKALIAFFLIVLIVLGVTAYWQHKKFYPSTDNAYVKANIVNLAPQVSGEVQQVFAQNNAHVKKGQLLFTIDPKPFLYALEQAKAKLKQTRQSIAAKIYTIKTARANVKQAEAEEIVAQQNHDRILYLVKQAQAPKSEADDVVSKLNAAKAALIAAQTEVLKAKAERGRTDKHNADLEFAKANLRTARLNLKHTKITAPNNGIIANFSLRPGDVANANQPVFSIIENGHWWLEANYKETDLNRIKPGEPASISLDIYPNYTFKGTVESISSGSGATFSILPPENATGNWVKVTQRFPVKIRITNLSPKYPLRVGASATVTIDARK